MHTCFSSLGFFFFSFLVVRQRLTYSLLDNHHKATKLSKKTQINHKQQIQQTNYLTNTGVNPENKTIVGVLRAQESGRALRRGRSAELAAIQQRAKLPEGRRSCKNHCFHLPILPHAPFPSPLKWLRKELFLDSGRKKWNSICSQQICNNKNKDGGSTLLMQSFEITPHFTTNLSMIYRPPLN